MTSALDDLENEANAALGCALGPLRRCLEIAFERGTASARAMYETGVRDGAIAERVAVVEFLHLDTEHGGESCTCLLTKAQAIEDGMHLRCSSCGGTGERDACCVNCCHDCARSDRGGADCDVHEVCAVAEQYDGADIRSPDEGGPADDGGVL